MKLSILPLGQRDLNWSAKKMGGGGTIGRYGCLLVCHAMALRYYGQDVMPDTLNEVFKTKGAYDGNFLNFYAVGDVYEGYKAIDYYECNEVACDLTKIDAMLARKMPVIAKVDFDMNPATTGDWHFVLIIGKAEDGAYFINDPYTGETYYFHAKYGEPARNIYGLRIYEGQPPEDTQQQKIDELNESVKICNTTLADKALEVSILTEKKAGLEAKVAQLSEELDKTRNEKNTLSWEKEQLTIKASELEKEVEKLQVRVKAQKEKLDVGLMAYSPWERFSSLFKGGEK